MVGRSGKQAAVPADLFIPVYLKSLKRELVGVYIYIDVKAQGKESTSKDQTVRLRYPSSKKLIKNDSARAKQCLSETLTPPSNAHVRICRITALP